jgi:hypothetical protein
MRCRHAGGRTTASGRRGFLAVLVLVCIVVMAAIGAGLLRIGLAERARLRDEERRLQAEWLVESGVERGLAALASRPDYRGETWEVPADALGGPSPARVTIAVESREGRQFLRVRADDRRDAPGRIRLTRTVRVPRREGGR